MLIIIIDMIDFTILFAHISEKSNLDEEYNYVFN